uniref:Serine proteinase stubble n=1 Tax=Pseudodiaptomus poplesia TaxID=213370 RepID=A0A0U2V6V0_9MAXI|nr:serine proteinase stubble [Pseudodiaptomus poplesia]
MKWYLLALLIYIGAQRFAEGNKTGCKCSTVKEEKNEAWQKKNSRRKREAGGCAGSDYSDEPESNSTEPAKKATSNSSDYADDTTGADDRIVGGYDTTINKPWIAKLWLTKTDFLCGASILNKRYLLTAGHCVCNDMLKCTDAGKILYTPADEMVAYLGVNNMKVEINNQKLKGNQRYEYVVEKSIVFPEYMKTQRHQDIALVKLNRDINFIGGVLKPICLPAADDKSDTVNGDEELNVYVAGWGRLFHACTTNELGPVKNLKCQFPFTYSGQTMFDCSKSTNPDAKMEACKQFRKTNPDDYPSAEGQSVVLMEGKANTTCNYNKAGNFGWCKVVMEDDKFDDNWGWCAEHCQYKEGTQETLNVQLATKLQETNLQVLPMANCKYLVSKGKYEYRGIVELCAGRKKKFKTIKVYEKSQSKYTLKGEETNYLGLNTDGKYPYDYYISGTDSCSGDSGGPMYTWRDGKPIIIGVVARGYGSGDKDGCGELNFPGIYTRTAKFLEWIHQNIADGNCT